MQYAQTLYDDVYTFMGDEDPSSDRESEDEVDPYEGAPTPLQDALRVALDAVVLAPDKTRDEVCKSVLRFWRTRSGEQKTAWFPVSDKSDKKVDISVSCVETGRRLIHDNATTIDSRTREELAVFLLGGFRANGSATTWAQRPLSYNTVAKRVSAFCTLVRKALRERGQPPRTIEDWALGFIINPVGGFIRAEKWAAVDARFKAVLPDKNPCAQVAVDHLDVKYVNNKTGDAIAKGASGYIPGIGCVYIHNCV